LEINDAEDMQIKKILNRYHIKEDADSKVLVQNLLNEGFGVKEFDLIFSDYRGEVRSSKAVMRKRVSKGRGLENNVYTCRLNGAMYRIVGKKDMSFYVVKVNDA